MSKLATMLSVALLLSSASYSAAECPKQTADALAGDGLDTRLTLSLKGSDLGTAFRAVGDATGLSFQLAGLTPAEGPVDLEVANLPARAVLRMLEQSLNLKYAQSADRIDVMRGERCAE